MRFSSSFARKGRSQVFIFTTRIPVSTSLKRFTRTLIDLLKLMQSDEIYDSTRMVTQSKHIKLIWRVCQILGMTHIATLLNTPLVVFDSRDEPLCSSDCGAEEGNSSESAPAKQPEEAKARHCRLHGCGPRLRVSKGIAQ